jgi:hypothetical protein
MNKNLYNGNRKIKSEIYSNPLSIYIDPLTLELRTKDKEAKEYITQFSFDKNMNLINTSDKPNKNYNEFMKMPSLLIPYTEILKLYNIDNLNDIIDYINLNLETKLFDSINRILNCWIRLNFNYLKKNNKILLNIYYKIFNHYYPNVIIDEKIFNKKCSDYINIWFKNEKQNSFFLNLGDNLKNYLTTIYVFEQ